MTAPTVYPARSRTRLLRWLNISPEQTKNVYLGVCDAAEFRSLNYWLEILFSAGIAVFGLVLNSPAVIIGAMLISPLMGPIMASGLALAAGDLYLALKAAANLAVSVALAVAFSASIVYLLPFRSITAEVVARTNPNLLDLGVALFSGLAGSVAVSRSGAGYGVTTLPGVAIAVALMPPLCTVGFGLGSGMNTRIMGGAGLLFLTNLVAIITSAFAVFVLLGMNSPAIRSEVAQSGRSDALARKLFPRPLVHALTRRGQLHWRVLILFVLLVLIAVPLKRAFMQVAGEAKARAAVQDVVKRLVPPGSLLSQQVEIGKQSIAVRLFVTHTIPGEKLREAETDIQARTQWRTEVSVATVASQSEMAELMQRFTAPPPPAPPKVKTLEEVENDLMQRIHPVVNEVWPPEDPFENVEVAFSTNGILLNVTYSGNRSLDKTSLGIVERELREKLNSPTLKLNAQHVPPYRRRSSEKKK
jgi:uncharacterized hydrophobic protein (TIGR00271 family)